jgi:hypothetical protein
MTPNTSLQNYMAILANLEMTFANAEVLWLANQG